MHKIQRQIQLTLSDQVTPVRLAGHLSVLAVAALILIISNVEMPDWSFSLRALPSNALIDNGELSRTTALQMSGALANQAASAMTSEFLPKSAVPFTVIQEDAAPLPPEGIQTYIVQAGDTVLGIAEKFGIRPETIQWANQSLESNPDLIRPGDAINVLPVDGALHIIRSGDTLGSLANKYKVEVADITGFALNEIPDASAPLVTGRQLIIPGGTKSFVQTQAVAYTGEAPSFASKGSGAFDWPTAGSIGQKFWSGHPAIDIGAWTGAPVAAADGGYVAVATGGWNGGYGNHVIIDHGNGFVTLYAHLNSIFVRPGENVSRGEHIGSVGNTGNSTGPHLHFEIRYQGVQRNPFSYLP
ncbi:MAG: peptidoglycan DD-metalloendopeptidase family protein [Caldilineaceae bacterium]|nr:peptidoglycan DD-metalloendopeptidase family protein [Caldilineaceae bacterium]